MTTIDHKAEAEESLRGAGDGRNVATDASNNAIAHALLYLAEQQRIANLYRLGVIGGGPISPHAGEMARDYLLDQYPDIAQALGLEQEDAS